MAQETAKAYGASGEPPGVRWAGGRAAMPNRTRPGGPRWLRGTDLGGFRLGPIGPLTHDLEPPGVRLRRIVVAHLTARITSLDVCSFAVAIGPSRLLLDWKEA